MTPYQPNNGSTGDVNKYKWTTNWTLNLSQGTVTHSFIVIGKRPYPLLGGELLGKLQATILFS